MHKYPSLFVVFFLVFLGCSQSEKQNSKLTANEFAEKIVSTSGAQIVDVRTQGEFRGGHIADASNIDISSPEFASMAAALDKDKPVFVYCLSGSRSAAFVNYLADKGFTKLYDMPGGLLEWRRNRLPEVKALANAPGMTFDDFAKLVESADNVLFDFYAEWCAPCKKMEPYINQIAEEMGENGKVIRIDVDQNSELAIGLGISAIPVLKYFKNQEEDWTHVGFLDEESLRSKIF